MRDRGNRQTGFSVLEGVLVIVVIGLLAVTGWVVYQHNRVKLTSATAGNGSSSSQQTNTTPSSSNQNVVKIPELGISITVPDSIKDLTYQVGPSGTLKDGRQETYAVFSTTSLTAADANCDTNAGPLGSLAKISGQYPTTFDASNPPMEYGQLVKQFPTFFISATGPQGACSVNPTAQSAASTDKQAFATALPTVQQIAASSTN